VRMTLFEERPPALNVEAEEYPRARKEPAYKAGRQWCRVGGPDRMVKQAEPDVQSRDCRYRCCGA
jgi:hypothetical protein